MPRQQVRKKVVFLRNCFSHHTREDGGRGGGQASLGPAGKWRIWSLSGKAGPGTKPAVRLGGATSSGVRRVSRDGSELGRPWGCGLTVARTPCHSDPGLVLSSRLCIRTDPPRSTSFRPTNPFCPWELGRAAFPSTSPRFLIGPACSGVFLRPPTRLRR